MEITAASMLNISLLTALMMTAIFGLIYNSERQPRQLHILEFWVSYSCYYVVSVLTQGQEPRIVALSSLLWVWRIRTIRLILEDVAGRSLFRPWHLYLMATGYAVGGTLGVFTDSFLAITLPASIGVFLAGTDHVVECYRSVRPSKGSIPHQLLLLNCMLIFTFVMVYPFLRYNHALSSAGFMVVLFSTILMAVLLPAVTTFDIQKAQQEFLRKIIEERGTQLESKSKFYALGEMTAEIVHEINNPLGIILGRASHLKSQVINDEAEKDSLLRNLDQIELTSERVSKIIRSLRKYTKSQITNKKSGIKLDVLLSETISFCEERFRQKNIKLLVAPIPEIEVEGQSVELSQVLINLLNNAFDAVSKLPNPWVQIYMTQNQHAVKIHIKDSGCAIPEAIKNRVLDPFFTTKAEGGTGLGLSISKKIVEDHGGRLYYDEREANTCFVIELPCRVAHADSSLKAQGAPEENASSYSM